MRLKDKVALFAGAGSNMSRATALLFAQEGAKVVLAARTTETMEETAGRICDNGGNVITHQTDLTDTAQVDTLIDAVVAEFGGIDCLIHAAGGSDILGWCTTKQPTNAVQSCTATCPDFRGAWRWMSYHDFRGRAGAARCQ